MRRTVSDAHARLDVHELKIVELTETTRAAAQSATELTRAVGELTQAVSVLKGIADGTQASMKTYVADTKEGRELLNKMLGEAIESKTGSWVKWAVTGAILSARDWIPMVWKMVHG